MKKRILSLVLSVIMLLTTVPFTASAADSLAKSTVSSIAEIAESRLTALAQPENKEISAFRDFLRNIFGFYKIGNEKRLKTAAKEGGDKWSLKKDFDVSSDIVLSCESLKIDGKNHKITKNNGDYQSAILKVINLATLNLDNITMVNTKGRCLTVNTYSNLIIGYGDGHGGRCTLESYGDTIVNSGYTQLSSGTILKATGSNSVALWNKLEPDTSGTATLYYCTLNKVLNDGTLNIIQSNSVITSVTNNGSVYMENANDGNVDKANITTATNNKGASWVIGGGHIGTLNNYGKLHKTGGIINKVLPETPIPVPESNYDKNVKAFLVDKNYPGNKIGAWSDSRTPFLSNEYEAYGCCAYCIDFLTYVYGYKNYASNGTKFTNAKDVRTGDILKFTDSQHWIVVLYRNGNSLNVAERWGSNKLVTNGVYTIKDGEICRNGKKFRTFSCGYHYDTSKALAK